MGTDSRKGGSNQGSYLVMQLMRDAYSHPVGKSSPSGQGSRFGSPTSQHLLSEIQKLQISNAKLTAKLAFAANRVPGLQRMLGTKEGGTDSALHVGGVGKREDSATMAVGRAPGRRRSTDLSGIGFGAELFLDDLLLSPEELQEAAMRCCWLARYWTLAEQLGICDDIAHEKAANWRQLALPLAAYFEIAQRAASPYITVKQPSSLNREASSPNVVRGTEALIQATTPGSMGAHTPKDQQSPSTHGATVADVVELERGLRQLSELGVVQEVLASLMHQRQAAYSAHLRAAVDGHEDDAATASPSHINPPNASVMEQAQTATTAAEEDSSDSNAIDGTDSIAAEISASEAQEVAFQRAWLAFIWARAAGLGVEPHVCRERAEHWGYQLMCGSSSSLAVNAQQPSTTDSPFEHSQAAGAQQQTGAGALLHAKELVEIRAGQQELARLGVEQQIWAKCRARLP